MRRSTSSSDEKKQDGPAEDDAPRDSDEDATQPQALEEAIEAQGQSTDQELERAEARRRRIYRWKVICGLTPCQVLAALDATIVSTALVKISSHFRTSKRGYRCSSELNIWA